MKLTTNTTVEFKNTSNPPIQSVSTNNRGQMIAPGASSCTLGCSCSCSCGTTNKHQ